MQAKHGIVTEAYGPLTPILRHENGGPLKPVLERIASRLTRTTGKDFDPATVLLLWTRAQGAIAVTTSGNPGHIRGLAEVAKLPNLLEQDEIDEITRVGKTIHFRHYVRRDYFRALGPGSYQSLHFLRRLNIWRSISHYQNFLVGCRMCMLVPHDTLRAYPRAKA